MAVSAWFTSSCRSRARRRRSSSWARSTSRPLRRRSASMRCEQPAEGAAQAVDLLASRRRVGSSKLSHVRGSIASSRSISSSSGEKRRRSIMMFASSASMIDIASSANWSALALDAQVEVGR